MTYLATARKIAPADFARDFASKDFSKATWSPKMFVLHNTDQPNLQQWLSGGATAEQRLANLENYYKGMRWHSGPHWFVAPDAIWEFCDPLQDGVHCSCANHVAFGCEMVGDYATESFSSGPGAQVRDNAVIVVSTVFRKFGWQTDPLVLWERGLAFHKNCTNDKHDCPGKNVDRVDFVARVNAAMGLAPTKLPPMQQQASVPAKIDTRAAQAVLNHLGIPRPPLTLDGAHGPLTAAAVSVFQSKRGISATGLLDPMTIAALAAA